MVKARKKSKTGKIICYHNCKIEKNLPNPNLGGAFPFHYFQMLYSLCFSPYIILTYAQYCIVSMLSKSLSVFQNVLVHIFENMCIECSTLLKTNGEEEFNWNMAHFQLTSSYQRKKKNGWKQSNSRSFKEYSMYI